jgi:outer membrane protein assembly factor BamE
MRLAILLVFLLVGCKQVPVLPSLTPYKIDIQQGNHVTQEMVEKLKPGMTRSQVKFLLGTPLVVDPFRNDRWDYVYLNYKAGELVEQRRVSVIFEQDKLKRVDGDVVAASPDSSKKDGTSAPPTPAPAKSTSAGDKPSDKPPAAGPGTAAATPAPKVEPAR